MSATINPEWVKLLEQERDAYRVEYECRADWIAKMNAILGYDNSDGFHSEPDPFQLATELKRLADIGKRWETDSSLEQWFPFTAEELKKLKELNEDKFRTINAYCRMASLDKWRVRRLTDAIDRYLSEDGYRDASSILTNARADAVNAKPGTEIPAQPLADDELDNKTFPTGPLKKYGFHVPYDDVDREYCTGYNHGLVLAEAVIEEMCMTKQGAPSA